MQFHNRFQWAPEGESVVSGVDFIIKHQMSGLFSVLGAGWSLVFSVIFLGKGATLKSIEFYCYRTNSQSFYATMITGFALPTFHLKNKALIVYKI